MCCSECSSGYCNYTRLGQYVDIVYTKLSCGHNHSAVKHLEGPLTISNNSNLVPTLTNHSFKKVPSTCIKLSSIAIQLSSSV